MKMPFKGALLLALMLVGCTAATGTGSQSIASDARSTCVSSCREVGMELTAIAIMGSVGCICEDTSGGTASVEGGSAAGGAHVQAVAAQAAATALIMQQQQRRVVAAPR